MLHHIQHIFKTQGIADSLLLLSFSFVVGGKERIPLTFLVSVVLEALTFWHLTVATELAIKLALLSCFYLSAFQFITQLSLEYVSQS